MSQEGNLLILKPSLLSEVCKGWPTDPSMPKPDGVHGVDAALELLEGTPLYKVMTMPSYERWVLDNAKVVYVGFNEEDDDNMPCPIYELADADFQSCYGEWEDLGKLADPAFRAQEGLKVYWFLWSY